MPNTKTDTRVVCGASCSWWDDISQVGIGPDHGLPCCPHCGGVLFEYPTMEEFTAGATLYEKEHPGYLTVFYWARGKCFTDFTAAANAFKARNHSGPFSREFLGTPKP